MGRFLVRRQSRPLSRAQPADRMSAREYLCCGFTAENEGTRERRKADGCCLGNVRRFGGVGEGGGVERGEEFPVEVYGVCANLLIRLLPCFASSFFAGTFFYLGVRGKGEWGDGGGGFPHQVGVCVFVLLQKSEETCRRGVQLRLGYTSSVRVCVCVCVHLSSSSRSSSLTYHP